MDTSHFTPRLLIVAVPLFGIMLGCAATTASSGGEGEPCACVSCSILSGAFTCNAGLVCDQTSTNFVCRTPHTVTAGGKCSSDDMCATNFICRALVCAPRSALGGSCGTNNDCVPGLACHKTCAGVSCQPADASSGCFDDAGDDAGDSATDLGDDAGG
jgi:hypothetical protein